MSQRGFTLLELLISLIILATLTAFSARAIQQALFSKTKIQTQIDEMSAVRDALKIMERDVNLAFHPSDLETEFRDAVKKGQTTAAATPTPPPGSFQPPPTATPAQPLTAEEQARKLNRLDPVTHFEGTEDSMSFVSMSASRLSENQQQADFEKVGYALKPCKRLGGKQESGNCLTRREDTYVEGDITKGGGDTVLLEGVSEFKLRYFGKGKQDWITAWSSEKSSDASIKDNYPNAVEISLTVENGDGEKKRKISMQIVAQVRFPNNPKKDNAAAPAAGAPPPPSGGF